MRRPKAVVLVAVLAVLAGGLALWRSNRRPAAPEISETPYHPHRGLRLIGDEPVEGARFGAIDGRVHDPGGAPVVATVSVTPAASNRGPIDPGPSSFAISSRDGRFHLTGVPPGAFQVTAAAFGFVPSARQITLRAGETLAGVDLQLAPGGHLLFGRVFDASGGVIAGAHLRFALFGSPAQAMVVAVADGGYRVTLPAGTHRVTVEAAGYAPERTQVVVLGTQARDFRLQPASSIAGRVLRRGTGGPVGEARVRAESRGYFAEAETDASGAFLIGDLEAGDYTLRAQAGPLAGRAVRPVVLGVAGRVEGVVIEVETARAISGRVVKRGGGAIAGARVELAESAPFAGGSGAVRGEALSGSDGQYRIEGVLPGSYLTTATAAGLARGSRRVSVADADVTGADVELTATGLLRGRVLDSQEQPVAGATIRVSRQPNNVSSQPFGPVRSEADGGFTVEYIDPGPITVIANHPEKGSAVQDAGVLAAGEAKEVTLRLRGGGVHLRGRVLWDDGSPATGLVVRGNSAAMWEVGSSTATGADGRYTVGPFGVGLLVFLSVEQAAGWEGGRIESQVGRPVRIERPGDIEGIDFKLPRPDARIAGLVVGPEGKPIAGAVVWTRPGRAGVRVLTGEDGRFAIEGLVREPYLVHAEQPGFPPTELSDVPAGTLDLKIRIAAGAVLAGQVVRGTGPVGPYTIWAQPARAGAPALDQPLRPVGHRWVDAADGAFELGDLPPGRYDLVALAVDGASGSLPGIAVRGGERRRGLRLELGGGAAVTGRLVDLDSRAPLVGAPVRAVCEGGTRETSTDGKGSFRFEDLARGVPGELRVDLPGFVPSSRNFTGPVDRPVLDLGTLPVLPDRFVHKNTGRIGMTFTRDDDGQILVRNAVEGSPASKAGLRSGDVILAVDGRSVQNADMSAVAILVGGPPGTPLVVDVRSGNQAARQVRIVRM